MSLIGGFGMAFFFSRRITRTVKTALQRLEMLSTNCVADLRNALQHVAAGDLTVDVVPVTPDLHRSSNDEKGVATVERTREAFEAIGSAVEGMSARVADISSAVEEISADTDRAQAEVADVAAVAEESSASAEQVSASTQQTSASAQEIAASAQTLSSTAEQLNALVRRFKVTA